MDNKLRQAVVNLSVPLGREDHEQIYTEMMLGVGDSVIVNHVTQRLKYLFQYVTSANYYLSLSDENPA